MEQVTTTPSVDLDSDRVITGLLAHGLDSSVIANALNVPISVIEARRRTTQRLTPEDEDLANGIRRFAWKALREAEMMLAFGTAETKLAIVRTVLPGVTRLLGKGGESEEEESRGAIERIWESMRIDTRAKPIDVEVYEDLDASSPATLARTDDPDEEAGAGQVPPG